MSHPPALTPPQEQLLIALIATLDDRVGPALRTRHAEGVVLDARDRTADKVFDIVRSGVAEAIPPTALNAWLWTVARRDAATVASRSGWHSRRQLLTADIQAADAEAIDLGRADPDAVRAAVRSLPRRPRRAVVNVFWRGLTQRAAARRLGWKFGTFRHHFGRGCAALRDRLAPMG